VIYSIAAAASESRVYIMLGFIFISAVVNSKVQLLQPAGQYTREAVEGKRHLQYFNIVVLRSVNFLLNKRICM